MSTALMPTDLVIRQATMYDTMRFEPYEFKEFPQAIPVLNGEVMPTPYGGNGKPHPVVIVNSQAELDALQGPQVALVEVNRDDPDGPKRVATEDDIRATLYAQAEQVGATVDKSWSVARIEDAIRTHVAGKGGKPKPKASPDVV